MPILDPEHLCEQAEKLVEPPPAGPPRQVDVRRAISAAYYAIFHASMIAVADHFVGRTRRGTVEYGLVYRSVGHRWLRLEIVHMRRSPSWGHALVSQMQGLRSVAN